MMQLARNLKWITTTALSLALVGTACSGPTRTIEEVHFSDYVNPFIGASTNTGRPVLTMAWGRPSPVRLPLSVWYR